MMTMTEAKTLGVAAAGQEFEAPTGSIGTILPTLSGHNKVRALMTCVAPGCAETHEREVSDWHQCGKCPAHAKTKAKKAGAGLGLGGRSVKLEDGTVLREMKIAETDDEEMRDLKTQSNAIFEKLYEAGKATREAAEVAKKAEREAAREAEKSKKAIEAAAAQKAGVKERLALIHKLAAERGVAVSTQVL